MGEEREHSRFTLVTAGGARSRGVAFGSPPKALAPAAEVEPRHRAAPGAQPLERRGRAAHDPARAVPDAARASCACWARSGAFWERARRARAASRTPGRAARRPARSRSTAAARASRAWRATSSRAASACWSRWPTSSAAGAGLEEIVAGLAPDGDGGRLVERRSPPTRGLAAAHDHLVALDPPPGRHGRPAAARRRRAPTWRGARPRPSSRCRCGAPSSTCGRRSRAPTAALRELPPDADREALQAALAGPRALPALAGRVRAPDRACSTSWP